MQRTCLRESKFSEEQVVRLILQELRDRGLVDSFEKLQSESGYTLEDESVTRFRDCILAGQWKEVEAALSAIGVDSQEALSAALFIIKKQQFLELLEARKLKQALLILQNELSALTDDIPQLHRLSSLLMCPSPEDLRSAANWDGSEGRSRFLVLESLQAYVSPGRMVPAHRMETLFNHSIMRQNETCECHIHSAGSSLYVDHACSPALFPQELQISLKGHKDEVWYVAFSPDGRYLASASRDKTCIIWNTSDYSIHRRLEGHSSEVSYLSWAPNSRLLVSASGDKTLRLWDVETGESLQTLVAHKETVTACRWLGDNDRFISGSLDQKIIVWNTKGNAIKQIDAPRVHDIAVSSDCSLLLVADNEVNIHVYDLTTLTFMYKLVEHTHIMSLTLSSDARYCLAGLLNGTLHMWDLQTRTRTREFIGHTQGKYVIRSGFAGIDDRFVTSGSEDGSLLVWNRETGRTLVRLKGHAKTVNGCAWNARLSAVATVSDDKVVCIWPAFHGARSDVTPATQLAAPSIGTSVGESSTAHVSNVAAGGGSGGDNNDDDDDDDDDDDESMASVAVASTSNNTAHT
ncbi:WD40 repeat-like protein [Martensiomyces pterosporus]|nr:WD40 repeat-like protein [Martensiomyces pterosporus]